MGKTRPLGRMDRFRRMRRPLKNRHRADGEGSAHAASDQCPQATGPGTGPQTTTPNYCFETARGVSRQSEVGSIRYRAEYPGPS